MKGYRELTLSSWLTDPHFNISKNCLKMYMPMTIVNAVFLFVSGQCEILAMVCYGALI